MESKIESMTDLVVEYICFFDSMFNTTKKMFIFTNIQDYLQFEEEQKMLYCKPISDPITIMDTICVYSEIEECAKNRAWGSLNFKVATGPDRFICGYQGYDCLIPIVMGIELTEEIELLYRRCLLKNYQGTLTRYET